MNTDLLTHFQCQSQACPHGLNSSHREPVVCQGRESKFKGTAMDQPKVEAVLNWPTTRNLKQLQRLHILWFMHSFSTLDYPLISLLWGKPHKLQWSEVVQNAFMNLKHLITYSQANWPWATVWVKLVSFWPNANNIFPCSQTFPLCIIHSCILATSECNFDVGNQEQLAIKASFAQRKHCLENAKHPLLVLSDHRNL